MRATSNSVKFGDATIEIMHSIQSTTPIAGGQFSNVAIANVDVHVIDAQLPGLVVTTPQSGLHVVEGSLSASYTTQLLKAPAAGETVTVSLATDDSRLHFSSSTLTFDSTNWNAARTITVSASTNGIVNGERLSTITASVSTSLATGGVYSNGVVDNPPVKVDVIDGDSGGVLVLQPDGNTVVSQGHPDTYTVQLTKQPSAAVTLSVLTDGKTLVSSADARFAPASGSTPPTVTFNSLNLSNPVTITVSVNPSFTPPSGTDAQPVQVFPAQPHVTSTIYGPLLIEGNSTAPRALVQGVRLPTETDVALPTPPAAESDATKHDTLNVFDDGYAAGATGHMGSISAVEFAALSSLYNPAVGSVSIGQFGEIDGLNMGGALTFSDGLATPITFAGGIQYRNVDVVDVMLGTGSDTFTVDSTVQGTITTVQGGGGDDTLIANGGGGPNSPLILLGDTSQDGSFYNSTTANLTGGARQFFNPGNDTIDVRTDPNSVTIYGGNGADTIYGGGGGDQLFGGSGNDTIYAGTGNDHIYGDDGINLDLSKRLDLSTQIISVVNAPTGTEVPATRDLLTAGADTIFGGAGRDIIIGDHGVISQVAGTNRVLTTGSVTQVSTVRPEDGGNDVITGGSGSAIVLAGSGSDTVTLTAGGTNANLVIGDNGFATFAVPDGWLGRLLQVKSTQTGADGAMFGAADTITTGAGADTVIGGLGADTINAGDGNNVVFGDSAQLDYAAATGLPAQMQTIAPSFGGNDSIITGAGSDLIFGGAGSDLVHAGDGADVVMGDNGLAQFAADGVLVYLTGNGDRSIGGDDTLYGEGGDDILVGGTGSDAIDGGLGKDLIFGDNVTLDRTATRGNLTNPRFEALSGTQLYSTAVATAGQVLVNGVWQLDPSGAPAWSDFRITLLDHAAGTAANLYGNDYIAGGGGNDQIFGELGNDVIQGDGSIDVALTHGQRVYAFRDATNTLQINPSFDAATDGDDYIEGGGGNDVIFGNQGQDDIIGGNSNLFSLTTPAQRPDGSDTIFGGSGTAIARNDLGDTSTQGHAKDSDMILGDNGNIFRIVGINGTGSGRYLSFNYDNYDASAKIVVRAAQLLDYTPGGADFKPAVAATDIGAADEIHGEAGDDFIFGMVGNDVLYGDGQNDSIVGGYGADWISGGTGDDGILGDDGLIFSSRNSASFGEPLYGIAAIPASQISLLIQDSNDQVNAIINVNGALTYTADLTPDNVDPNTASQNVLFRPKYANDIIYGGLGNDSIHGGAGDDAISGAEAAVLSYATNYDNATGAQIGTVTESDFSHPFNPGNPLGYNPSTTKFALYDANDSLREVLLTPTGTLSKTGTGLNWILNFDATEGPKDTHWVTGTNGKPTDGDDRIFGDLGNDWAVGGTGRDQIYGGWGDDLLNADDDLTTNGTLNNRTDTDPSYSDLVYGGAGRDVLIGNTGADRLVDWVGEFNTYLVPYSNYGLPTVLRLSNPAMQTFLLQLSKSDGADPTLAAQHGGDPARNGEPFGELGMVVQGDSARNDQNGGPRDPQAGNLQSKVDTTAWGMPIMQVAAAPAPATPQGVTTLTDSQLAPIVVEAKQLWTAALGAADPRLTVLNNVDIQVGNLPDGMLGETTGNSILIDRNAGGWGWFVDPTPQDNSEFSVRLVSGALAANPASAAFGRMDLLTTVLHEMGNAMGFAETDGQGVMGLVLDPGVRTLPGDNTPLHSAAPHAEPQPFYGMLDATPIYVSADRSIDWSQSAPDLAKPKKGGAPVTAQPAWVGDFVNHLARTNSERNPNLGIRVQVEAASKVSSTLRGG